MGPLASSINCGISKAAAIYGIGLALHSVPGILHELNTRCACPCPSHVPVDQTLSNWACINLIFFNVALFQLDSLMLACVMCHIDAFLMEGHVKALLKCPYEHLCEETLKLTHWLCFSDTVCWKLH